MLRALARLMASAPTRVPIPRNGVDYRGKVVLAPMVRSGELPSRLLALQYGADLVWGPETVDKAMIGTTKRFNPITSTIDYSRVSSQGKGVIREQKENVIYKLHPTREKGKLIFQVGTSSPETAVEASRLVAEHVAGIDVNAGCPKPFSTHSGMGAALLRTPDLLVSILEALVKEIGEIYEIGISVKIRLLETPEETEALVRKLCGTGITGLTIHCRTTPMRPRERAIREHLRMIASICRETGVACVMNGDVKNRDEAIQLIEDYGVDGAMIATAAEANSSCFRSQENGGLASWREVSAEYMRRAVEVHNRWGNTKFLLAHLIPGKTDEGKKVANSKGYRHVCEILNLEDLIDAARELDERLGMDENRVTKAMVRSANKNSNKSAQAAGGNMAAERKIEKSQHSPLSERGLGAISQQPAMMV